MRSDQAGKLPSERANDQERSSGGRRHFCGCDIKKTCGRRPSCFVQNIYILNDLTDFQLRENRVVALM